MYGSCGTAHLGSLVPLESEPAQRLEDQCLGARDIPLLIRVLDAQDEGAACVAGSEPGEEGCADGAEVQRPGGRGREPRPDLRAGAGHLVRREENERQDRPGEEADDEHRRVEVGDDDAHHPW